MTDTIFEQALERLQRGENITSIAESFPEHQGELLDLLPIARLAMDIPKLQPPVPTKHYRFVEDLKTLPYRFADMFSLMRMAMIPISLVAVFFGGRIVVHATENSLPGEKLYSLKRASEEARLNFTFSENATAVLHLQLSQKRLNEVKKAVDSQNPTAETAALAELKEQTQKTFAVVPQVAAVNAVANQDSTLLDNLVAINKEQKSVLATLSDEPETITKEATQSALDTAKENDKTIAKIIATVNEHSLIDLPNRISVTGTISAFKDNKLTIEKNVFIINDQTVITDSSGSIIDALPVDATNITVIGSRIAQGLIARTITIVAKDETITAAAPSPTPPFQGATTIKPSPKPSNTPSPTPSAIPSPSPTPEPTPLPTNQATGTFIIEPNIEKYAP